MTLSAADFLSIADHTLLAPAATRGEMLEFLAAARELGVARVCVSPTMLPFREDELGGLEVVTVVGFPNGAQAAEAKAFEAALAAESGAREIDMVVNHGLIRAGDWGALEEEIAAVRSSVPGRVLKVILETALHSDEEIVAACRSAEAAGADFVKTSTGFSPAGGASVHAVRLMAETVGGRLGVKASGGIRTAEAVRELAAAGATRFGVSATAEIVRQWIADSPDRTSVDGAAGHGAPLQASSTPGSSTPDLGPSDSASLPNPQPGY